MWQLFWTELKYNKLLISAAYIFCLICFVTIWFGVTYEHNRVPLLMLIILVSTFMVHFTVEGTRSKENRNRVHVLLPISSHTTYVVRFLLPIFLWISIALLLVICQCTVQSLSNSSLLIPSAEQLLSVNGLVLLVTVAYLLNSDNKTVPILRLFTGRHHKSSGFQGKKALFEREKSFMFGILK